MAKIISWNVNSINARIEHAAHLIKTESPDIILFQELKCESHKMPLDIFEDAGYNVVINGQKSYNGVAIASRFPIEDVKYDFPHNPIPEQKRYIEIECIIPSLGFCRVASLYAPNGGDVTHERFAQKTSFYDAFCEYSKSLLSFDETTIIGGDYNIAPLPIDIYDYKKLKGTLCCSDTEIAYFRQLVNYGYEDLYRILHPDSTDFTWWDYRGNGFAHNKGYRIDHFLTSSKATENATQCYVNTDIRALERPSDHAPLVAVFGGEE